VNELHQHLNEQVGFLRKSALAFDNGDGTEAKRLVAPIRVLVHQTSRSHALLHQLGVLNTMTFFDTAGEIDAANMLVSSMLTVMRFSPGRSVDHHPPLGNFPPRSPAGEWRPFDSWWIRPIIKDSQGAEFSRKDLVLAVAHKDGGVHVDALQDAYERLSRSNSLGWTLGAEPLNNPVLPSLRQIAFEVEQSLCRVFPALAPVA
jgi:hypothetical protein